MGGEEGKNWEGGRGNHSQAMCEKLYFQEEKWQKSGGGDNKKT